MTLVSYSLLPRCRIFSSPSVCLSLPPLVGATKSWSTYFVAACNEDVDPGLGVGAVTRTTSPVTRESDHSQPKCRERLCSQNHPPTRRDQPNISNTGFLSLCRESDAS